jgi:predicted dehydrogenase
MLHDGTIGELRSFKATFSFPPLPYDNFRYDQLVGGGALLDAAAYTVKAAQVFLGNELQFLSATMNIDNKRNVDITGSAHFFYNQEVPVHLTWGFDNYYQCGIDVLGSKGKLTTNRTYTARAGFVPQAIIETPEGVIEHDLPEDDHFQKMLNVFADRISNGLFQESAEEIRQQSAFLEEIRTKAIKGNYA